MDDVLVDIQRRQLSDKPAAERMLLRFIRETFPLDVVSVELRPLAVSLNSFNGILTLANGHPLFFKSHTEPDPVITEFYNAALLSRVGYPMVEPVYSSVQAGRQILIYEVVEDPSVFDVAWRIERGDADPELVEALTAAQHDSDRQLLDIYLRTLEHQEPGPAAAAPIHQLFHHRLAGPRMRAFYSADTDIISPIGSHPMRDVSRWSWRVNGQTYSDSLRNVLARSAAALEPARPGPSIIGHGDAHNGNVFFNHRNRRLTYFDPAFGGRHDPLLDLVKPLFHNTFAMWMYHPEVILENLSLSARLDGDRIEVEHDYALPPVRLMFFESKLTHTLTPLVTELRQRGWLTPDWRTRLKAALFCCPLLTKNLADRSAFPPKIGLLGLAMAMEMGAESGGERSLIDRSLDTIAEIVR